MNCEIDLCEKLPDRRLALMLALAGAIEQTNQAVISRDLKQQQVGIGRQQELCRQWNQLEREMLAGKLTAEGKDERSIGISAEMRLTEALKVQRAAATLQDLNRLQAALIRRVRRTADIFCRVLASAEPTYGKPSVATEWAAE